MNISEQKNNQGYYLSSGSVRNNDALNYKQQDYNNYQSWSNVGRGNITVNSIDEGNNIVKSNFKFSRLQPLGTPFSSYADTNLSWAPVGSIHSEPNDKFMKNNKKDLKKN